MSIRLTEDLASGALAETLADIAEAAAAVILPYWRNGVVAETKADDSPVTRADREAEALILERLAALYPEVQAVAEEAVAAHGVPASLNEWFWLIDPLDGTRGFVEGRESYTVNIALIHRDAPVAGVVSTPATGITWRSGAPGKGAFRRRFGEAWTPIQVRERPASPTALMSHSLTDDEADRLASRYGCLQWQGTDSSLKFCLIAEGRFDAYPRIGPTSEWDTAAGQAVLEAAGGRVLAEDGERLRYGKPGHANGGFVALGG
ncbi:3'(2'),5'-bisphosphate nucleotidase CysQ [Brevundimonas sp. GCM10030266]|uniref:3'(2'),5'-bisphosphate nucleotidase CysQ n=1 Tax=Brevundimonas sp. GCM10030266 TaxID=3273386 RepID=UPI003614614A